FGPPANANEPASETRPWGASGTQVRQGTAMELAELAFRAAPASLAGGELPGLGVVATDLDLTVGRELGLGCTLDRVATGDDAEVGLGRPSRARLPQPRREVHLFFDLGRVKGQRLVLGSFGLDVAVQRHARPRRDELADDHVLLQALEPVGATFDRRFG